MGQVNHPRLKKALENYEGVDTFKITQSGSEVLVLFDGAAHPAYVFAELNRQQLVPKGTGLRICKKKGLK